MNTLIVFCPTTMHRSAIDVDESIPVMCNKAPPPPEPMAPVE